MFGRKTTKPSTQYQRILKEYNDLRKDHPKQADDIVRGIYLGFALDTVDYFKTMGIDLDFSVESIKHIEKELDELHDSLAAAEPPEDAVITRAKAYGGYVGTVLTIHAPEYHWSCVSNDVKDYSSIVITNGNQTCFVVQKAYKQLLNGHEDSIWTLACVILGKAKDITSKYAL